MDTGTAKSAVPEFTKPYKHILTLSEALLFAPGGPFANVAANDQSIIRANNRKAIDRILYESGGLTKQEISERLSLSLPTVTGILQDMQDDGLILTRQEQAAGAGRPPVKYSLDRHAHAFVSVVLEKKYIRLLVTDAFCEALLEQKHGLEYSDTPEYWDKLCETALSAIYNAGTRPGYVVGINLLMRCHVDPVNFCIQGDKDFPCASFDMERMEKALGFSVYVNNIHDAAAYHLGQEMDGGNLCYVNLSEDITSVMIAGKRVFRTQSGAPGAAGHITLVPMGRKCPCGKTGCARAYCSTDVFEAVYGETVEVFVDRLEEGRIGSTRIVFWHEYLSFLANFLANQSCTFQMPVFLGGRLAACMGAAAELLKKLVDEYLAAPGAGILHIVQRDEDLALMGGIRILFHNYI